MKNRPTKAELRLSVNGKMPWAQVGPTKVSTRVEEILHSMNYDPIKEMVLAAKAANKRGDLMLSAAMAKEICKYMYPQLKAVEHSGGVDHRLIESIEMVIIDPVQNEANVSSS